MKLTTDLRLVPSLQMSGTLLPFFHVPSWPSERQKFTLSCKDRRKLEHNRNDYVKHVMLVSLIDKCGMEI